MSTDKQDSSKDINPQAGTDLIVAGVLEVVNAAFGIGAILARTIAQQTSGGETVPEPESQESALNEMVHYGVAAVTNVVGLVVSGVGVVSQSVKPTVSTAPAHSATPSSGSTQPYSSAQPNSSTPSNDSTATPTVSKLPTGHQGSILRVPLSIENPGNEPMNEVNFVCLSMSGETESVGQALDTNAVRFQPTTLNIAPKDFEKLTVFIETHSDTAIGLYKAVIGMGQEGFETTLQFRVLPTVAA